MAADTPASPPANPVPQDPSTAPTPTLLRRLAALLYEGILLFGVLMAAGLVYGVATDQRHALSGQLGLQAFLFVVLGTYFVWFWTHGGQTLAQQTWHIRLVQRNGQPVTRLRAAARYLLAWLWFAPGLALVGLNGLHGGGEIAGALIANVAVYATLVRLHPDRQFLHDAACGTRLITWRPPSRKARAAA